MKDIIITTDPKFYMFREGLFAAFQALLGILPTLEEFNLKPILIPRALYFGKEDDNYNMIPYLVELNYIPEKIITLKDTNFEKKFANKMRWSETENEIRIDWGALYKIVNAPDRYSDNPSFSEANKLFFKYYKFTDSFIESLNNILPKNEYILGLHYRGSDKITDRKQNPKQLSDKEYISIISEYIETNNIKHIFIATDSDTIIDKLSILKIRYNCFIYYQNCTKYYSVGQSPFRNTGVDNVVQGLECLRDSVLLSHCNVLIQTNSAVSAWSKIFNPELESYRLHKFPLDWFPAGYLNPYKSENKEIQKILDKVQS